MKKEFLAALAWAGAMLLVSLTAIFLSSRGYIDYETTLRVVIGINGLMIVYYGNRLPKKVVPNADVRKIVRVSAWSQVLSGLVYAGLWAFAPIPLAITLGSGAILASLIVTIGYSFWRTRVRADA